MDGCKLYAGEDTAPVLLNITYSLSEDQEAIDIQKHFRKNTTVGEMKVCGTPVYVGVMIFFIPTAYLMDNVLTL